MSHCYGFTGPYLIILALTGISLPPSVVVEAMNIVTDPVGDLIGYY